MFVPLLMCEAKAVVALRAPPVPLRLKKILHPQKQTVNPYRTRVDSLLYRVFTMVSRELRSFVCRIIGVLSEAGHVEHVQSRHTRSL